MLQQFISLHFRQIVAILQLIIVLQHFSVKKVHTFIQFTLSSKSLFPFQMSLVISTCLCVDVSVLYISENHRVRKYSFCNQEQTKYLSKKFFIIPLILVCNSVLYGFHEAISFFGLCFITLPYKHILPFTTHTKTGIAVLFGHIHPDSHAVFLFLPIYPPSRLK